MYLNVKNKAVSITGSSKVLDDKNNIVYIVKGGYWSSQISKSRKKRIYDSNKKLYYIVKSKLIHKLGKRAAIIFDSNKNKIATIQQTDFFKFGYEVEGMKEKITIDETGVRLGNKRIGSISFGSAKMTFNDSYTVEVNNKEDAPLLVALTIAIDNMHDADREQTRQHTIGR